MNHDTFIETIHKSSFADWQSVVVRTGTDADMHYVYRPDIDISMRISVGSTMFSTTLRPLVGAGCPSEDGISIPIFMQYLDILLRYRGVDVTAERETLIHYEQESFVCYPPSLLDATLNDEEDSNWQLLSDIVSDTTSWRAARENLTNRMAELRDSLGDFYSWSDI